MDKKLSIELFNRVSVWVEVLGKVYQYLLLVQDIETINANSEEYFSYDINENVGSFHKSLTIRCALLEAATINFASIFSSGYEGNKIAGQNNMEVKELLEKIKVMTLEKLNWPRQEFDVMLKKIITQRNKLLAHYDGNAGEYEEIMEGLSSRKMAGINLLENDLKKFQEIVKFLFESAHLVAYGN